MKQREANKCIAWLIAAMMTVTLAVPIFGAESAHAAEGTMVKAANASYDPPLENDKNIQCSRTVTRNQDLILNANNELWYKASKGYAKVSNIKKAYSSIYLDNNNMATLLDAKATRKNVKDIAENSLLLNDGTLIDAGTNKTIATGVKTWLDYYAVNLIVKQNGDAYWKDDGQFKKIGGVSNVEQVTESYLLDVDGNLFYLSREWNEQESSWEFPTVKKTMSDVDYLVKEANWGNEFCCVSNGKTYSLDYWGNATLVLNSAVKAYGNAYVSGDSSNAVCMFVDVNNKVYQKSMYDSSSMAQEIGQDFKALTYSGYQTKDGTYYDALGQKTDVLAETMDGMYLKTDRTFYVNDSPLLTHVVAIDRPGAWGSSQSEQHMLLARKDGTVWLLEQGSSQAQKLTAVSPDPLSQETQETAVTDKASNGIYKVTSTKSNNRTAMYKKPKNKNATKIIVPATIKISGKTYKVTAIANNAFKKSKKLKTVKLSSNIKKIGKNAFIGCKQLKKLVIKSKKLTSKTIGKNAFKGIPAKATVDVPNSKIKAYKKLLRSKGLNKKAKIK